MDSKSSSPGRWAWISPWMIVGLVCVLAGILLTLAVKNFHREKQFMMRALLSEANVLMRSLEAGSRAGMMGMGWGLREVQTLMEETAQQPDVLYVALVDSKGKVVAHSDDDMVGKVLQVSLPAYGETSSRFSDEGERAFEVVRAYHPWTSRQAKRPTRAKRTPTAGADTDKDLYLVLALDPSPFESALNEDLQHTAIMFGTMFLVGAAGFLSIIWAQYYRVARRSLKNIEAFTATLVNQMPVGLVAVDRDGRIQRTNEAALSILKCDPMQQGNIRELPCFVPLAEQLRSKEIVIEHEVQCRVDENHSVPLLVNAAVIHDADLDRAGYVFLFADLTGIKQLEEQLRRSERLAALGRLAAGVAHEIRNPLSSIKGFATILAGRFSEDDRDRKIAQVMEQEVERLNRVISELLDFARPTELRKRICDCVEIIRHSLGLVERDALQHGVSIEYRVDPEDLKIEIDPDRFAQVLLNLYLNALQAMENGGTLKIGACQKTGRVILSITDSGIGISAEHLPHVFDPYFTTKPGGVGLGLANVHKIVEAHGGEIEVVSVPGQETSFIVSLPDGT